MESRMDQRIVSTVGATVKQWRKKNGVSQSNLAYMIYEETGERISTMRISNIENSGKHPRKETLAKLIAVGAIEKPSWLEWENE